MSKKTKSYGWKLTLWATFLMFLVLCITSLIVTVVGSILVFTGVMSGTGSFLGLEPLIIFMALTSIVVGVLVSMALSILPIRPVNRLIARMNQLAGGDYSVRISFGRPFGEYGVVRDISDSFNKLAGELENTEMLRRDFINNFSHEFKTPIVSIAGFAKLLKKGNLSEGQKLEYLDIIEKESLRLSQMATNVLNLTKVESQTILTDVTCFNLAEQIRACILLLENKWANKGIELRLELEEYAIEANEELLKQVWINLIDNAVKFAPAEGIVGVSIAEAGERLRVTVYNTGSGIPAGAMDKIFNKFYQGDESHAAEGNGIGLSVVKRVAELHGGRVEVKSGDGVTSFTIDLPREQ